MSPDIIGVIGVALMLFLIFMGTWVGTAMLLTGFLGFMYLEGFAKAMTILGSEPYAQIASYVLACVPLYILMGIVVSHTGIAGDLYNTANKWIGSIRGGLAVATTMACGAFAAICGSSDASAAAMGKVAYPEMVKFRYDRKLASACVAAGGTIGILIPPSLGFILYGLLTEQSIGKLYMAGFLPGILQVVLYSLAIYIMCKVKPSFGPAAPRATVREKFVSLKGSWAMLALFLFVIGGIYAGIFTPTEAGALGAFGALAIAFVSRRLSRANLVISIKDTAQITAMIAFLVTGAFVFMRFLAVSRLPAMLSEFVIGLQIPPVVVLFCIIIFYVIIGCFWDIYAALILTLPLIFPVIQIAGFDPIWFGVIIVKCMEIGLITPPFGLNVFVLSSSSGVPVKTIFSGVWPFLMADVVHLALLLIFPQIALLLPNLMRH
jgi:tripartite ATP-independent transporter DctM subunit